MPSRIIREGIVTSEPVNKLTFAGEVFYRRLMSVADDYGRYFAHPGLLRGGCFPLCLETITEAQVSAMLAECVSFGLVSIYNGGKHLEIINFRQQKRFKSKFPEPPTPTPLNESVAVATLEAKRKLTVSQKVTSDSKYGETITEIRNPKSEGSEGEENLYPIASRPKPAHPPPKNAVAPEVFAEAVGKIYGRLALLALWPYEDQRNVVLLIQRPNVMAELEELRRFKPLYGKYFPHSLSNLLPKWEAVLEASRNPDIGKGDGPPKKSAADKQTARDLREIEALNRKL